MQELCLELCLELLSLGLAPRPLHARGQQGESSPRAAPVGCAGAGGFCSPVGCLFGSSSRVKIQPRWYFQFVFLRGGADAIGCSRSPSVTSGFFFFLFNGICPGLEFPAYQIPVHFVENQHQGRGRQRPSWRQSQQPLPTLYVAEFTQDVITGNSFILLLLAGCFCSSRGAGGEGVFCHK